LAPRPCTIRAPTPPVRVKNQITTLPLLYLIGVNHAQQFKAATAQLFRESERVHEKREAFKAHVAEMIDKLHIEILAEEFSDEGKYKPQERETDQQTDQQFEQAIEAALAQCNWETVLEQLSKAKGIEHRFCDPDSKEKQALGIEVDPRKETDSDRDKREQFWLSKIADCKRRRVLFVCGDDHYDAFAQKVAVAGFTVHYGPRYHISKEEFLDL
jgi:hypothetical protein